MLKKKLFAAVIAVITGCSVALTAFAYPWDDPDYPQTSEPSSDIGTSEPQTSEPDPGTSEPSYPTSEPYPPAPPEMTLDFYETTLTVGSGVQLYWTITNSPWEDPPVKYYSADSTVASVDEKGFITANGVGTTYVTAYYDTLYAATKITVVAPPPEMQLDFYQATLEIGKGIQLYWTITNSIWENPAVSYESSDVNVVRVDNKGYIMAFGEGTAQVTASFENLSATATITVVKPAAVPEFLVLKQNSFELKIGATAQIEANILPEETADGYTITYKTDNPDIAEVNENGLITAVKTGTAVITVSGAGLTETVNVTVTEDIAYETAKLDGYLYDHEGNPVVGAQIVIDALKTVSDTRGYFSFESVEQRELNLAIEGDAKAVCRITPQGSLTVYLLYKKGSPLTRLSSYEELVGRLPINSVSFVSGANVILTAGETFELEYQYKPRDVQVTEINYAIANEIVAEVGQIDGIVTAKAPGETDITITLNGGQAQAVCHVVVNPKESTEHSALIAAIETVLIAAAALIFIIVYRSYKKKLNRTLEQYEEEESDE